MAGPHGVLNGTEIKLYFNNAWSAYAKSCTLTVNMATRDTTSYESSAWETAMEGNRSWSVQADGLYAWETAGGGSIKNADHLFKSFIKNRNLVTITFGSRENESGDVRYDGKAWITSLTMTGATEDSATYSVTLEGYGELDLSEY